MKEWIKNNKFLFALIIFAIAAGMFYFFKIYNRA